VNPIQPIELDDKGVPRFKKNAIVRFLLDNGGYDMNDLYVMDFSREDREQFAQLIGYSLGGFSELSYVTDETYEAAENMFKGGLSEKDARIKQLEDKLQFYKDSQEKLRKPIADFFGVDEDNLRAYGAD
jgi:hypothetical protein